MQRRLCIINVPLFAFKFAKSANVTQKMFRNKSIWGIKNWNIINVLKTVKSYLFANIYQSQFMSYQVLKTEVPSYLQMESSFRNPDRAP